MLWGAGIGDVLVRRWELGYKRAIEMDGLCEGLSDE